MIAYPGHGTLRLPPVELLSDRDLAAHLVHDHGIDAAWLNDDDNVPDFIVDYPVLTDGAGYKADARDNERAVDFLAAERALTLVLHQVDHDAEGKAFVGVLMDDDTSTWNDHDHARGPVAYRDAGLDQGRP